MSLYDKYDDVPVKGMLYPSLLFMATGMLFGIYISFNAFLMPEYFSGEYIHFGRVRPVHVNSVLFLWLLSANVALVYYMVQRLCGIRIWSPRLARIQVAFWWIGLIPGTHSFPFGTNTGWEYAELPFWAGYIPVRALFFISWALLAVNVFMTIGRRQYQKMYVSLWYTMATLIWTSVTFWAGWIGINMIPYGISRVNANFFYVHNLVGLTFTPLGLATAYYFLPKLANTPIYSHRLSMIGFWAIAFVYAWIGAHHIIHGPISQWLQTVSIIFSMWLFIPVFTVVTNLFVTLQPKWQKYIESPAIRFLMMGNIFYLITCIQGPLMALRNINEITSKTDWVIGHSHISLYATFSFFAFAGIYYVIPSITQKPIWSKKLSDWHFSLNLFGSIVFILPLWIGGYIQGLEWASWASGTTYAQYHRNLSNLPFLETLGDMYWWWMLRLIGGIIVAVANIIFVINLYNTLVLQRATSLSSAELRDSI
ncbi:MAG: hypothetical protein Tsb0021_02800 [Chlamydiales bacterium]